MEYTLIAVMGPTASGKTQWALKLAEHFGGEIVSCDSRQCYREMRIGVARPSADELARIPHHFIADRSIHEPLSAGQFEREALARLNALFEVHPVQAMVGGSGLFARALLEGFDELPAANPEIREALNRVFEEEGIEPLQKELQKADPEYYNEVDTNNHMRVIRALEVIRQTGRAFSQFRQGQSDKRPFRVIRIAPDWERDALYKRIDGRVDDMMKAGLEAEARDLYPCRTTPALQTVGYRELFTHFDGDISLKQAIELIRRNTRNYAKRQLTWNRKESDLSLFPPDKLKEVIAHIESKFA